MDNESTEIPPAGEARLGKGEVRVRDTSPREADEAKLNGFYMECLREGKPEKEAARLAQEKLDNLVAA